MSAEAPWTDPALDQMREIGDPPADELARRLGSGFPRLVHDLFDTLGTNGAAVPASVKPEMRRFLQETAVLPAWADEGQIDLGQRVFSRFGPQIVLALTCAALPECYAAARGAQILNLSPRLRRHTHRRVLETAQLVLDVMAPGGLGPQGCGVRTVQKVRLLHAVQRPYLARQPGYHPSLGRPINQEDMLGTLMAFSMVVLDSLGRLGVELSRQEEDAYLHIWLVVGCLLGIDERMFPRDPTEARRLAEVIRRRHHGPSEAGRALARALVRMLEQAVPGTALDGFVCVLIRHLVGDRVADLLDIPRPDWTRALLWPLRLTNALLDRACDTVPPLSRVAELFGHKFLEGVYVSEQGGEPVRFYIPPELAHRWGVRASAPTAPAMALEGHPWSLASHAPHVPWSVGSEGAPARPARSRGAGSGQGTA